MTRRIVAITVAIVLAALGAAGGLFEILTADQRAQDRLTDGVSVAVASTNLSVGTTGARVRAENLVKLERVPRSLVPADALTTFDASYDKLVLTSNVAAGTMLLKQNFGEPSEVTSGLPLEDGKLAVTVQTGAPQQVAGYVQPGSEVTIFLTYSVIDANGTKTSIERTRVLLPRVQVLAVGSNKNQASGSLMVTVAVSPTDAERLIEGLSHGTLYLGLLTDSVDVKPDSGVDNTDSTKNATPLFK
jgi:pilus assembly protein CpaB